MRLVRVLQLACIAALVGGSSCFLTTTVRLCGRMLSDVMSRVCRTYNSPTWEDPLVMDDDVAASRRRRDVGIADECCNGGCNWEQLREYCADGRAYTSQESSEDVDSSHSIAGRSAEVGAGVPAALAAEPVEEAAIGFQRSFGRSEVGSVRSEAALAAAEPADEAALGFRRSFGRSEVGLGAVVRAAPVVGTVSPLLTWGRTLHADLPQRDRLAYVSV